MKLVPVESNRITSHDKPHTAIIVEDMNIRIVFPRATYDEALEAMRSWLIDVSIPNAPDYWLENSPIPTNIQTADFSELYEWFTGDPSHGFWLDIIGSD